VKISELKLHDLWVLTINPHGKVGNKVHGISCLCKRKIMEGDGQYRRNGDYLITKKLSDMKDICCRKLLI